MKSFFSSAS